MVQDWMFSGVLVVLGLALLYVWLTRRRIDDLESTVDYLRDSYNKLFESQKDMEKEIQKNHETMQDRLSALTDRISELEKQIDILNSIPEDEKKEEKEEEKEEEEKLELKLPEIEYWGGMEKLETPDEEPALEWTNEEPALEWSHKDDEIIGYRWMFPTKEKCIPVCGQRYMVVGVLYGHETMADGSPFICTEEATWDRYKFVTDNEERFDKTYAYIKMPDSSDIMKSILEITLRDKEG